MHNIDISVAAASLQPHDPLDLAERTGALQMMPENGANVLRLELAATVASTLPPVSDLAPIGDQGWRQWLAAEPFGSWRVRALEDAACNPFTEPIIFYGGSYTVLPGTSEHSASQLQTLLNAIFLGSPARSRLSREFVRSARELAFAALSLADRCATKAGLRRDEIPDINATDEIVQPGAERLELLRNAVSFSLAELKALFRRVGVEALAPLTMAAGEVDASVVDARDLEVYHRPILRVGARYVLIAPGSLPAALTHAILCIAAEHGDLPVLADCFRDTVFESADLSLKRLGCTWLFGPHTPGDHELPVTRALYKIDTDKVLGLILLTDPLDHFDPDTFTWEWSPYELTEQIAEEIRSLEAQMALTDDPPNGLLALILLASPGQNYGVLLNRFDFAQPLALSADDLNVIGRVTSGNPLLLWQHAKASDRLRDSVRPWGFNPLDEFAFWRSNGFSYYLSDDGTPSALIIASGSALETRIEARDLLDVHALPAPSGNAVVEVMRFQTPDVPIYTARPGSLANFSLALAGLPLTLWIEAVRVPDDPRFAGLMRELIDFVAYWTWQFHSHLHETHGRLAEHFDPLVLEVDLHESEAWYSEEPTADEPLKVERTERGLKLTFLEGAAKFFDGGDNAGERQIVRIVLDALHDLGADSAGTTERPSGQSVAEALDLFAPLGLKKKILRFGGDAITYLDDSGLPPYRPLQPAVTEEWRDREHELLERLGLSPGRVAAEQRIPMLNGMVAQIFDRFEQVVASLSPEGLLEMLVALGERLIWREEHERTVIPTRIACYSSVPKMLEDMKRDLPILTSTTLANRFIIEYVVAQPPTGLRPFSFEAYDELIALATILIGRGRQSDALYYRLSDTELTVLESGRLGSQETVYAAAVDDYAERSYTQQILHATAAFSSMFQGPSEATGEPPITRAELDEATRAEFGMGMEQTAEFIQALSDIGSGRSGPTKLLPEPELRRQLTIRLRWADEDLDAAFRLLSLGPRAKYLEPIAGLEQRDLYPWAFNRRMSYLSRPLLMRVGDSGENEMMWAEKALARTNEYLFRQIVEGRLHAVSHELRSLQGRIANHTGEAFNDRVADVYGTVQGSIVRRRVERVAGRRIERNRGEPLGDIDVLVADEEARVLLLVETKDFSAARTPSEFASEEKKLREALEIHSERCAWFQTNLGDALQWLAVSEPDPEVWQVEQLVVVSSEAFTPGLRSLPAPVKSLSALRQEIEGPAGSSP